ncbi:MAG: hypothetical protein HY327_10815 [Chloroflexi bacterium]|nr:hypothetical protein [Chloroflexota bacterium]
MNTHLDGAKMAENPESVGERMTPDQLIRRLDTFRERLKYGLMTANEFKEALRLFQFSDDVGHLWAPGATSNQWYRWDRTHWTAAPPPPLLNVPTMPAATLAQSDSVIAEPKPALPPKSAPEPAVMSTCPHCNAHFEGLAKFCPTCGKPQIASSAPSPAIPPRPTDLPGRNTGPTAQAPSPFIQAEDKYFTLRGQLETGRITREQFKVALQQLMIQDAQGQWWIIGADDSKWYVSDGMRWSQSEPPVSAPIAGRASPPSAMPPPSSPRHQFAPVPVAPQQFTPPPMPVRKSRGGCGCWLKGCLVALALILVLGVAAFFAYQSGAITLNTVLNVIGMGPGDIEIDNFRDDAILVSIRQIEVSQDSSPVQGTLNLNAFDIKSFRAQNPGRYRVDFTLKTGGGLGTCTLTVRSGDHYQFVALPDGIMIHRANNPSSVGRDLNTLSSSFCRG